MIPESTAASSSSNAIIELANTKTAELTNREFTFPTIAAKVLKAAEAYQKLDKNVPAYSIEKLRKTQLLTTAF